MLENELAPIVQEVTDFLVHIRGCSLTQWKGSVLQFLITIGNLVHAGECDFSRIPHLSFKIDVCKVDDEMMDEYHERHQHFVTIGNLWFTDDDVAFYYHQTASATIDLVAFNELFQQMERETLYLRRFFESLATGMPQDPRSEEVLWHAETLGNA